jgi:PAS domain S-box-containing protein
VNNHPSSEERLRLVVNHAPVVLWATDRQGVFTLAEGRGLETMGPVAHRMAVGRSAFELYRDVQILEADGRSSTGDALLRRALAGEPCVGLAEIGEARYDTRMEPLRGRRGEVVGVIGVATDVTERARAEAASQTSRASFRALIERTPEMIIVHREARVVYVNPAAAAMLRYGDPAELLGRRLDDLFHPDERHDLAERVERMTRTGQPAPVREFRLLRRGGEPLATELVGMPVIFDGAPAVVSIGRDVAARKETQAHLLQTDRLVALGTLAAGVAHEINNPLTYVMGNLELVSRLLRARADECRRADLVSGGAMAAELEELSATLGVARDGAERVRRIVRDLTTFAHSESEQRALLDVRAVLGPVLNLVANEIRQRAALVQRLDDVPLVEANEARLGQVLMNLLLNAAQAIPEGDPGAHEIGVATFTDAEGRAVFEVRDTGSGIPEDVLARIFEPFFTTKPVGLGTGLGLSICHGTVTALGGEITVRSTPSSGSVFHVAIPAAELRRQAPPEPPSSPAATRTRARILVVDDEPLITATLHRALAHHDVEVVTGAEGALQRVLGGRRFDVILCDLLMPGMTGMELGDALARELPEQAGRVVFMTGGAFTAAAREFLERVPNPRLDKPIDFERLDALIHALVEAPRPGR